MKYKYAMLEGDAVLLGEHEAWTYQNGRWTEMSNADAFSKATLITAGTFRNLFHEIEGQLPAEAFTT